MKKIFLLSISILFYFNINAQDWIFKTLGFGSKPSIEIDLEDRPHIAFMLERSNGGFLKHAILQDTGFVETLIDQAYYYGPLAIAMDTEGKPAIAVHHHDDEDEYVYRWDGTLWEALPVANEGHDGWDNSITFDSQNNIHTSSINPAQFGSENGLEYAFYDGNTWVKEPINAGPASYEFSTCIKVDKNDIPHVVFYDDFGDNLVYANKIGGEWSNFTAASKGGMFASMILDDNNQPHITYYEQVEGDTGKVHYIRYENGAWKSEVVDELFNVPIAFTGARNLTSLVKDSEGKLHLCYGDRKVIKYAKLEDELWNIEEILNYTDSDTLLGAQVSMVLDSKNVPHITYFEVLSEFPLSGNIKYATQSILSSTNAPTLPSLTFTVQPNPTSDQIIITFTEPLSSEVGLRLLDENGRLIRAEKFNSKQINCSLTNLPAGVYIVELKILGSVAYQKVVKN